MTLFEFISVSVEDPLRIQFYTIGFFSLQNTTIHSVLVQSFVYQYSIVSSEAQFMNSLFGARADQHLANACFKQFLSNSNFIHNVICDLIQNESDQKCNIFFHSLIFITIQHAELWIPLLYRNLIRYVFALSASYYHQIEINRSFH